MRNVPQTPPEVAHLLPPASTGAICPAILLGIAPHNHTGPQRLTLAERK